MKKLIPIFFLVALIGCNTKINNWSTIKISGKVEDNNIKSVLFYPVESLADDESLLQNVKINSDGTFKISYSLTTPTTAMMMVKDNMFMVYLKPEEDLRLHIKKDLKTLIVGDRNNDNAIFLDYQLNFPLYFNSDLNYSLEAEHFSQYIDSIVQDMKSYVEKNKILLSSNFREYLQWDISYFSATEKINYALWHANNLIKTENNYFEFLESIDIQNHHAINNYNYLTFIENYINYLYLKKIWGPGCDYKNDYIEKYYIAKSELSGKPLELLLVFELSFGIGSRIEKEKFELILNEFLSGDYSEKSKNIIRRKLSEFQNSKLAKGNFAPEFTLKNIYGKSFSLSDFEKEFIVLDFWASWCEPCRKVIPKMLALSEKFKDKAQFVFISLDKNKQNWMKACEQLNINEPSLMIDSISRINYEFENSSEIPFYLIIDRNKKIISNRPTIEQIESILKN